MLVWRAPRYISQRGTVGLEKARMEYLVKRFDVYCLIISKRSGVEVFL
jgi:hypothetical protein